VQARGLLGGCFVVAGIETDPEFEEGGETEITLFGLFSQMCAEEFGEQPGHRSARLFAVT
jgi:hypothetical protein